MCDASSPNLALTPMGSGPTPWVRQHLISGPLRSVMAIAQSLQPLEVVWRITCACLECAGDYVTERDGMELRNTYMYGLDVLFHRLDMCRSARRHIQTHTGLIMWRSSMLSAGARLH